MAIWMRMRWDGVSPEQYDQVRESVGWERDRPAGGILHEAWFEGGQLNVCDVWDSVEDFNAFVQRRLMPGVAETGIASQPVVEILPLYNAQLERPACPGAVVEEDQFPAEAYKLLEAKVGWRQVPPTGGISHVAAIDGDMVHSVSVWEKQSDHDSFLRDRMGPAAAELGFPEQEEEARFYPLHALFDSAGVLAAR